jgi:DNA polymerase I
MLDSFSEIWMADFEFNGAGGNTPRPVCMVAQEYRTGKIVKLWKDELENLSEPPFNIGKDAVFIAYYASAELGCFKALGWKFPNNVIDLYVEFRCLTNGTELPAGKGLLGALVYYGIKGIEEVEKEEMRNLILGGGPWNDKEKEAIIEYCASDVYALGHLVDKMHDNFSIYSLLRGNYMKAVTSMECSGVPIDVPMYEKLGKHWESIKQDLITETDKAYGVYQGETFKTELFKDYLIKNGIRWPLLPSDNIDLKDDTFKAMCKTHPQLNQLRELRSTVSRFRLFDLQVGHDGRNRTLLSPFASTTGRNQPSNTRFIFGPSVWLRGLIKPAEGYAISYVDWKQQEFGIAAALSQDIRMMEAYDSGDPYLAFAKQAGAVPTYGTKKSHPVERDLFKSAILAVQYGMGAESLALRINKHVYEAKELLRLHKETYGTYWKWIEGVSNYAMLYGNLHTTFNWRLNVTTKTKVRTISNFLMQANGAEMLRLACCRLVEQGITVIAPVHDAIMIEASTTGIFEAVEKTQQVMSDASAVVLKGFKLGTDIKTVTYPERYMDERGEDMWNLVQMLLGKYE